MNSTFRFRSLNLRHFSIQPFPKERVELFTTPAAAQVVHPLLVGTFTSLMMAWHIHLHQLLSTQRFTFLFFTSHCFGDDPTSERFFSQEKHDDFVAEGYRIGSLRFLHLGLYKLWWCESRTTATWSKKWSLSKMLSLWHRFSEVIYIF